MGISLVVPAASEPITVDEALSQCRVTADTEDGLIAGYIMAAREFAEKFMRRALMQQTFDLTIDFHWPYIRFENPAYFIQPYVFWRMRIELPVMPLAKTTTPVQWVKYVDSGGMVRTLDPSQYIVIGDTPVPYIEPAFGVSWPEPRYQPAAISVRFDAGFGKAPGDIPNNIRQALLMLVAYWYDNRGSAQFGARARQTGGESVTSSLMPSEIPPGVTALLSLDSSARILS